MSWTISGQSRAVPLTLIQLDHFGMVYALTPMFLQLI